VKIIENLPLTAGEIYEYSLEFLEEAYKITKYDITQQNSAKKFIVGEGEFSSFERMVILFRNIHSIVNIVFVSMQNREEPVYASL